MEKNKNSQILNDLKVFFQKEDYNSAIDLIKSNQNSFEPGLYEYNLGISYFKNNEIVQSRVWLEKAKQNGFYSNELQSALEKVTSKLEVTRLEESQSFSDTFNQISVDLPVDAYYTVSLTFFVLLAFLYKRMDKYLRVLMLVIAFSPLAFYHIHVKVYHSIIVLEDQIVYRGPSAMFEQIQLIPKGMKLLTGKTHNGWRYILTPSSHRGWFNSEKVQEL